MSMYSAMISKATGVTDPAALREIETIMRQDIFHSTLDWQDRATFDKGAREAHEIYNEIHNDSPKPAA